VSSFIEDSCNSSIVVTTATSASKKLGGKLKFEDAFPQRVKNLYRTKVKPHNWTPPTGEI